MLTQSSLPDNFEIKYIVSKIKYIVSKEILNQMHLKKKKIISEFRTLLSDSLGI